MARKSNSDESLLARPLTARSVIGSLLLGRHPPAAPASLLVRWCALFGISETTARVALTRMAQAGELSSTDGTYELGGRIRDRQVEQDFAVEPRLAVWTGEWVVAIPRAGSRPARDRLEMRRSLEHLRMRPLRDGVWMRPDNLPRPEVAGDPLDQCVWLRARPAERDAAELAALWDVAAFDSRSALLLDRLLTVTQRLPAEESLADAFVTGAAAAQHLRRDPLLPEELLPDRWCAGELRAAYVRYLRSFGAAVAAWAAAPGPASG